MKVFIPAEIVGGKLDIGDTHRAALNDTLSTWPDGPVSVTIDREQVTRSQQANAYYWAVVVKALSEYSGHPPDETHETLKMLFLPKDVALLSGNGKVVAEFVIGGSTTKLSSGEFFDYIEQIRQWAFERLDVSIRPPDPEWRRGD